MWIKNLQTDAYHNIDMVEKIEIDGGGNGSCHVTLADGSSFAHTFGSSDTAAATAIERITGAADVSVFV